MIAIDNQVKSINGQIAKSEVFKILKYLYTEKEITTCSSEYRCGYDGFNEKQFYAPYIISFANEESWIIYTTNSLRSDRICFQQWNAENIKKINKRVTKAFIVVPNELRNSAGNDVEKYNSLFSSGEIYTAVDGVYCQDSFIEYVKNHHRELVR